MSDASEPPDAPGTADAPAGAGTPAPRRRDRALLVLLALGVVYGDIGTSPLYALRECFHAEHGLPLVRGNVLGVLSLVVWSLLLVVTVKYLGLLLRADNRGEGGILALMALTRPRAETDRTRRSLLVGLGLFGAALLYGDGMITPAISVLSAVEGLQVATPIFQPWIVPLTIVVLVIVFAVQRFGTHHIGFVFGPLTLAWFAVLGGLGLAGILRRPEVLAAFSPLHAVAMFETDAHASFVVLSSVFLAVTGAEALYADLGHFGPAPIRAAWLRLVLPALLLNYLGQGALLLSDPSAVENPFYRLAPAWARLPLVALATAATIIASQAVISGAFSLTRQAMQLGYCPRLRVVQTSDRHIGQVYIPQLNWLLLLATIWLVLEFGSSSALAGAYGVAVAMTMSITSLLFAVVATRRWGWRAPLLLAFMAVFFTIDAAFLASLLQKIGRGGWFPLAIALAIFTLMSTWKRGREALAARRREASLPLATLLEDLEASQPRRVPGIAVFLSRSLDGAPAALLHNLKHNHVLHERVVLLTVETTEDARVPDEERVTVERLGHGVWRAVARVGFFEPPALPPILDQAAAQGLPWNPARTTFFLSRETLVAGERRGLPGWRRGLYTAMARNATSAAAYFDLPPNRVVEIGSQVEI